MISSSLLRRKEVRKHREHRTHPVPYLGPIYRLRDFSESY